MEKTADTWPPCAICRRFGWVLLWGLGPNLPNNGTGNFSSNVTFEASLRLLDPQVLQNTSAAANRTVSPSLLRQFEQAWQSVERARPVGPEGWAALWSSVARVVGRSGTTTALKAHQCADPDACVGRDGNGDCICYHGPAE